MADAKAEFLAMRVAHDDVLTPAVRGGTDGLEVVWFVALDDATDDGGCSVGRALAAYVSQPVPVNDVVRRRLEDNGVRLVRVPLADVPGIEASLKRIGARNRDWIGWALDWREAFSGRSIPQGGTLIVDGDRERTNGGTLRLLARCWTAPATDARPGGADDAGVCLRLELVAQLRGPDPARPESSRSALGLDLLGNANSVLDARNEGRLLPCISLDAALEPGYAYFLAPEQPGRAWGPAPAKRGRDAEDSSGLTKMSARAEPAAAPSGPLAVAPPTIGEAMLMNLSRAEREPAARAVVILIPRTPGGSTAR